MDIYCRFDLILISFWRGLLQSSHEMKYEKGKYTNAGHGLKLVIKCFVLVVKYTLVYIP